MRYRIWSCLITALLCVQVSWSAEKAEEDATKSAQAWLAVVDQGKYLESWDSAAKLFQNLNSRDKWKEALTGFRTPLGKVASRSVRSAEYNTTLRGAPPGRYVVIKFDSSFENQKEAVETVTPMQEADGTWKVAGYLINFFQAFPDNVKQDREPSEALQVPGKTGVLPRELVGVWIYVKDDDTPGQKPAAEVMTLSEDGTWRITDATGSIAGRCRVQGEEFVMTVVVEGNTRVQRRRFKLDAEGLHFANGQSGYAQVQSLEARTGALEWIDRIPSTGIAIPDQMAISGTMRLSPETPSRHQAGGRPSYACTISSSKNRSLSPTSSISTQRMSCGSISGSPALTRARPGR